MVQVHRRNTSKNRLQLEEYDEDEDVKVDDVDDKKMWKASLLYRRAQLGKTKILKDNLLHKRKMNQRPSRARE